MRYKQLAVYRGSKFRKLEWLLPKLPRTDNYVDPFCGTGSVFFNKYPPSRTNLINDYDKRIVNMLQVVRDRGDELADKLELTPCSRTEFERAIDILDSDEQDPLTLAHASIVYLNQSILHSFGQIKKITYASTKIERCPRGLNKSSEPVRNVADFFRKFKGFLNIECCDGIEIIEKTMKASNYDVSTLIYCDPPYLASSGYESDYALDTMSEEDHEKMLSLLVKAECKVAVSSYPCDLYNDYLKDWEYHSIDVVSQGAGKIDNQIEKMMKTEGLWLNYGMKLENHSLF